MDSATPALPSAADSHALVLTQLPRMVEKMCFLLMSSISAKDPGS